MDPTALSTGALLSVLCTEFIEVIKQSKYVTTITKDTDKANRILGAVVAFLTGLGIHLHFDSVTGQLIVSGLLTASVGHAFLQWAQQQAYYRLVVKASPPTTAITSNTSTTVNKDNIIKGA